MRDGVLYGVTTIDGQTRNVTVPDVPECHGHRDKDQSCAQCDGRHDHRWAWVCIVRGGRHDHAWRCLACGTRRCDASCTERRHHLGPHRLIDGTFRPVGV
jgi:hypothetical protein